METETKQIGEYQLCDHGIDHAQYFQGCGTAFTDFDNVVTGCGDNFAEALDDALDSIAQDGFETDDLLKRIETEINDSIGQEATLLTKPSASEEFRKANEIGDDDDMEGCELYYYLSIRWNVA